MSFLRRLVVLLVGTLALTGGSPARATYWSLFNFEGESAASAVYVTYATLPDLLNDTNRLGSFVPGVAAENVVGTGSDGTTYWSLFNFEGEGTASAVYVTYATLADMLNDTNRVDNFVPGDAARNVVGTSADGSTYWSLFNFEGESATPAVYVTYATLANMLNDTNRVNEFVPGGAARNVVGTGSDGSTYWSLFNLEGEGAALAVYVTYATLDDMLNDTNRLNEFVPGAAAANVVGTASDGTGPAPVPEPASLALLGLGLAGLASLERRARAA